MTKFKNIGISLIYIFCIALVFTFFVTLFNYFNIISDSISSIAKIIIPIFALFIGGIRMGLKSKKGGYKNGIVLGLVYCSLLIIINLIFFKFEIKYILFYIILIITSMLGSIIGIQKNKKD